ncbi:uncharacterized protein LOC114954996 isoform X2 [Acropora millepora]|uniref:uncharacterized protein LOC114954996 isoform X2 n=1 Tax=Acropora millepora TaxID=45264 RepID=UPI001CF40F96|nr:uncharacterized protein LOC114954996 isoform X2 [Acropora millepora]
MPPTRRYTRLRPRSEDGVRQSLFLPASDDALVGKTTLTIGHVSVIFFFSIFIIVGVLAQIAHDVYNIATFVLYPFWLTFHVILSPFVTLTQALNILLQAILHVFVCIFTAIGTFIWANIFSISLFLWFRNTFSATFLSKIHEVEDDNNDRCKGGKRCNNYHCPLPYQWQYRPYLNEWKSFNAQDNCRIEELFCDPSKGIVNAPEIEVKFKSYRRDRKYEDSSYEQGDRQLREEKKNFPSHWSSMPPKSDYYRAHIDRASVEFKELENLFTMTMKDYKVRIQNIDRVQNLYMMEKYCRKKEKMRESQQTVDERSLFHGTTPDVVEAICKRNFDWRLSGKHATRFGQGSYFARDASYSHRYAKRDTYGFHHMFVAKVLVGSCIEGRASYRTPPPKNPEDPGSDLYDSCVDNQTNPLIFVVFDTDQLYPEYVISYSTFCTLDSADSHQYSLPQISATPKRAMLKSSTSRKVAPPKTSRPNIPLQTNPSISQPQVLQRTSTTSKREIAQSPRCKTETSGPVVTSQSTRGNGIHAKLNPSSSQSRPGLSLNPSYLATKKPSPLSKTDSYYSSRSPDFNLGLSVTQDAHLLATPTAEELKQPKSLSFLCDHSTSNSGNEYLTTTIAASEDPSLPRSLNATGGNPSTTSMLWALDELEKLEQQLKEQKDSEECLIL